VLFPGASESGGWPGDQFHPHLQRRHDENVDELHTFKFSWLLLPGCFIGLFNIVGIIVRVARAVGSSSSQEWGTCTCTRPCCLVSSLAKDFHASHTACTRRAKAPCAVMPCREAGGQAGIQLLGAHPPVPICEGSAGEERPAADGHPCLVGPSRCDGRIALVELCWGVCLLTTPWQGRRRKDLNITQYFFLDMAETIHTCRNVTQCCTRVSNERLVNAFASLWSLLHQNNPLTANSQPSKIPSLCSYPFAQKRGFEG